MGERKIIGCRRYGHSFGGTTTNCTKQPVKSTHLTQREERVLNCVELAVRWELKWSSPRWGAAEPGEAVTSALAGFYCLAMRGFESLSTTITSALWHRSFCGNLFLLVPCVDRSLEPCHYKHRREEIKTRWLSQHFLISELLVKYDVFLKNK